MRIMHVSDRHGSFPNLKGYFDVVVDSGDMLPDPPSKKENLQKAQLWWLENHLNDFKKWLSGKPFLFTCGNHDWLNAELIEQTLNDNGIQAYCLHDKLVTYNNVNFYGFPYVPPITGEFAYESVYDVMVDRVNALVDTIKKSYIDVVVAHCPPANCLDLDFKQNRRFGNIAMADALNYKLEEELLPCYYLTGHVHSSHGFMTINGMMISNAAMSQHIIEV